GIPNTEAPAHARHGRAARYRTRDGALPERLHLPHLRGGRRGRKEPHSLDARHLPALHKPRRRGGEEGPRARHPGRPALRHPGREGRGGERGLRPGGSGAARHPRYKGCRAGAIGGRGRVPVRVHEPRALRDRGQGARRGPERREPRTSGPDSREPGRGRSGHHRAIGHDGRAGRGSTERARPRGLLGDPDHGVLSQVRLGLLRSVPRGRRQRPSIRRPARLPDGPGERPRGVARGRPRRRGGRGHRHGQARAPVPRCYTPRARRHKPPRCRLQRERRVLDAKGRRTERLARRGESSPGDAHRHKEGGGGDHHHLPRPRRRSLARL
ncbi:MAG: Porphobilinogen synthase, partial [uncultured Rubrobacteraceae bacterium]